MNICRRHNEELTPAHIKICENFEGASDLEDLIQNLKKSNIREWHKPEIIRGIAGAINITCRIHALQ